MKKKGLRESAALPRDLAASLGRMIASHSLLEDILAKCLYRLSGVDFKTGRVVVGNPRSDQLLERMLEVSDVSGMRHWLSAFPWKSFGKTLVELKNMRDTFAHSVWLVDSKTKKYVLVVTKGKWAALRGHAAMSKRIYPEPRVVTASDLRALRLEIEKAIEEARTLDRTIQIALQVHGYASKQKSAQQ
jgi:hypothetical protein